jgi:hypothetical protein
MRFGSDDYLNAKEGLHFAEFSGLLNLLQQHRRTLDNNIFLLRPCLKLLRRCKQTPNHTHRNLDSDSHLNPNIDQIMVGLQKAEKVL